jgi:hypothetical protein
VSENWKSDGKEITLTERNPYTELTILQRRYVDARLQGLGVHQAARAAGAANSSSGAVVTSLEKNPKVRAAIRWCIKESGQRAEELTKNDVMTGLLDAVDAAATASELVMAWRELGKLIGAYEPEKKILEIHEYNADDLKMLSDKELAQLAGDKFADAIDAEYEELSAK